MNKYRGVPFSSFKSALSLGFALLAGAALSARADVRLPAIFGDGMVLQQGTKVPVWGWADNNEEVTVTFQGQRAVTVAKDGYWRIVFNPLKVNADPEVMTVTGRNLIRVQNILVGEVWICSGQSNMEWPLNRAFEAKADIDASANPMIRLFTVPKTKANEPLDNIKGPANWLECKPINSTWFSAVGYYFGRDLQKALKVPVGLIHTSWGGSPAEVWMSQAALEAKPDYKENILGAYAAQEKNYKDAQAKYTTDAAAAKKSGGKAPAAPRAPWKPTELYNGMIAPIIPFAVKGAIWYQGESNAGRAYQYRSLFPDMIKNWRKDWGVTDSQFTFLSVQLAPFMAIKPEPGESTWAELREAQLMSTKMQKVGMAVITDVGEEKDIHPTKKAPVGARLALAARSIAYGEKIVGSGPVYKSMKVKNDKTTGPRAILSFDHVGAGLEAKGGELKGFAIAGEDHKFVWGKAEILPDNTIAVSHPDVKKPTAVRYGWADFPVVNLWNKDGLPATPFRTDDLPGITAPKDTKKK
jgi:sialate O-acetylesterase